MVVGARVLAATAWLCASCVRGDATEPAAPGAWPVWSSVDDIPGDGEHGRVADNWVVTNEACATLRRALAVWLPADGARRGAAAAGALAEDLNLTTVGCEAACLGVGAPLALASAAASIRRWPDPAYHGDVSEWFADRCLHVEVGWLTYGAPATLFWLSPAGERARLSASPLRYLQLECFAIVCFEDRIHASRPRSGASARPRMS